MMNFLPIGTVVLLKEATKKIMIIGYLASDKENEKVIYDYIACLYPEGIVSSQQYLLFNHEQIDKIFYKGYDGEERKDLLDRLLEAKK